MAETMIPEGILNERRDRIRVLRDEAEAAAKKLVEQSEASRGLTPDQETARIEHQSEAAAYAEAYYIMGVGMPQPTSIYPVWLNAEQAEFLIGVLAEMKLDEHISGPVGSEEDRANGMTREEIERSVMARRHMESIVSKIKGAAGSKGTQDAIYQSSSQVLGRA